MAGSNVAGFGAALKTLFAGPIADAVPKSTYLLSTLEDASDEVNFSGTGIDFPVDVEANTSYGAGLMDGGVLPSNGSRTTRRATVDIQSHSASTSVTDETIERSKNSEGAFIQAVKKVADDVKTDLRKKVSQSLYGKIIWAVTANSSSTTLTLESVQYLYVGAILQVGNRTTGTVTGERTVTARNIAAKTVTINSSITVTSADDGVWFSGLGPVDTKHEGLDQITGTSRTLHNISGTTYTKWNGNVVDANGSEIGEQTVIGLDSVIFERELGEVTDGLTTPAIRDDIAKDLQSQKRFAAADTIQLKGGYSALIINDKPIVRDADCRKGRLYLWSRKKEHVAMAKMGTPGFMAPPGTDGIFQFVRNTDGRRTAEYETTYRLYLNLISRQPGATGRIEDIADNDPVN